MDIPKDATPDELLETVRAITTRLKEQGHRWHVGQIFDHAMNHLSPQRPAAPLMKHTLPPGAPLPAVQAPAPLEIQSTASEIGELAGK